MISIVTSCSAEGWEKYGRRFVDTYLTFWPSSVQLYVVSEDLSVLERVPPGVVPLALAENTRAMAFLARYGVNSWAAGNPHDALPEWLPKRVRQSWRPRAGYCFRHDAVKFCKKVFAIELVAGKVTDRLFWVDADVVTFAPVPESLFDSVLPRDVAVSYLARDYPVYYSECGFVGYNLSLPVTGEFISRFADLYASEEVFLLAEWHDSWVFDYLRMKLDIPAYKIPHKSAHHPFINSELGAYMDHLKGGRKKHGRSYAAEQVRHRHTVSYWK